MTDNRTFKLWCKRMGITIFKDGRKLSVLSGELLYPSTIGHIA